MGKNKKQGYKPNPVKLRNKLYCYSPGRVKEQTVEENRALYEELKNKNTNILRDIVEKQTYIKQLPSEKQRMQHIGYAKTLFKTVYCRFIFKQLQHIITNYANEVETYTTSNNEQTGMILEAIGGNFIIRDADFTFIQVYDNIQDILETLKPIVFSIMNLFATVMDKVEKQRSASRCIQMPIEERYKQVLASIIGGEYNQIIGHDMMEALVNTEIVITTEEED